MIGAAPKGYSYQVRDLVFNHFQSMFPFGEREEISGGPTRATCRVKEKKFEKKR
jgi:hypothetical protein